MACWYPQTAVAFRSDPPAGRTGSSGSGGATCRSCHGNNVGGGSVQIVGVPDKYQANAIYDITVRVADSAKLGAGFQLSVEDASGLPAGTLSIIDAVNTQLNTDDPAWVNHRLAGVNNSVANWAASGNSVDYLVRWQAPSSDIGPITFWAIGNAINNNFNSSGDNIYLANKSASFIQVPAVSEWGLVVLTLCVLTAGTLALRRAPALTSLRRHVEN